MSKSTRCNVHVTQSEEYNKSPDNNAKVWNKVNIKSEFEEMKKELEK